MTASAGFRSRRQSNVTTSHAQLQQALIQAAGPFPPKPVIVKAFLTAPQRGYRPRKASWAKSTVQLQQTALTITYPPKPFLVNAAVQAPPQWRRRPARWVKSANQQEQADRQAQVMHAPATLVRAQANGQRRKARVYQSPTPINASQTVIVVVVMYMRSVLSRAAPVARRKALTVNPTQRLQQALLQSQVTPIRSVLIPAQSTRLRRRAAWLRSTAQTGQADQQAKVGHATSFLIRAQAEFSGVRRRAAWLRSSNQQQQADQQSQVGHSSPMLVRAKAQQRRPAKVAYSPTPINASQGIVVAVVMYMRSVLVRAPAGLKRRGASNQKNQAHLADAVLQSSVTPQKSIVSRAATTTRDRPRGRVIAGPIQGLIAAIQTIIHGGGGHGVFMEFDAHWNRFKDAKIDHFKNRFENKPRRRLK